MQVNGGCPVLIFERADVKVKGMISFTFEKLKDYTINYKQCFPQFSIIIEIFVLHLGLGWLKIFKFRSSQLKQSQINCDERDTQTFQTIEYR